MQSQNSNKLSVAPRPGCSQITPNVLAALIDTQPDYLLLGSSLTDEEVGYILSQVQGRSPQTCCISITNLDADLTEVYPELSRLLKDDNFLIRGIVDCHQL